MALRKTKIASELVLNKYRYFSSKTDPLVPISSIKVTDIGNEEVEDSYRYVVSNTKKPNVLPKIEFPKEPEELIPPEMRHLQPAMLPKFMELRDGRRQVKWDSTETDKDLESPFPEPIKDLRTKTLVLSDQKKAELKSPGISVGFKTANFNIANRNYSTSPFAIVSRSFAKSSKSKGGKEEKCKEQPKKCRKNEDCPSFVTKDCPPAKPKSDCYHAYMDPKCSKKMAPYPSYSESCAERLEDDPSECMQCPWQKCGGAEAIKPPKRHFHTSTILGQNQIFMQSDVAKYAQYMPPYKQCDAKKEPCKRPPGKCEKSNAKEEKKKKCPEQPKKKKCDSTTTAYGLWDAKENILPAESWQTIQCNSVMAVLDSKNIKKFPFDKDQADYDKVRKKKCGLEKDPRCHRKKRKILPDGCSESDCRKDCSCTLSENRIFKLEDNCPKNKSGDKGPHKKKCPDIDTTIDPSLQLIKEHDKGHPPPCPNIRKPSKQCPKDNKKKKIYRQQRDLDRPSYKRNREPWVDEDA